MRLISSNLPRNTFLAVFFSSGSASLVSLSEKNVAPTCNTWALSCAAESSFTFGLYLYPLRKIASKLSWKRFPGRGSSVAAVQSM